MKKILIGSLVVLVLGFMLKVSASTIDFGSSSLKYGMRSTYVSNLQTYLGITPATGYFGKATFAKVKEWQKTNGLPPTGLFGNLSKTMANGGTIPNPNPNPSPTGIITPDDAYTLCSKSSCPTNEVTIRGELTRGGDGLNLFNLYGTNKTVYVTLSSTPFPDQIKLNERLYTIQNGRVQVEIKGTLSYNGGAFCTMNSCQQIVNLNVNNTNAFTFIKKLVCKGYDDTVPIGDCFSLIIGGRSTSQAYDVLVNSNLFKNNKYNLTGYVGRDIDAFHFQAEPEVNGTEGGCSTYYIVSKSKITLERKCADVNQGSLGNLTLEQSI